MANDYEARLADPANKWFHARILQHKTQETDDRLFIEGYASTPSVDRDDEIIDPIAFRDGIAAYMKNPILLFMHSPYEPVGGVISMDVDDAAGFYIKAFLSKADRVKDYATMVKERILRAFSVGFRPLNASAIEDGKRKITELELWEVSIVSIPSNRDALFSVAKALKWGNDIVVPQDKLLESLTSKIVTLEDVKKLLDERDKAREGMPPDVAPDGINPQATESYKNFNRALDEIQRSIEKDNQREAIDGLVNLAQRIRSN